ncbi:MAG: hypothetical protein AB8B47_01095 [Roseobacter sp.]
MRSASSNLMDDAIHIVAEGASQLTWVEGARGEFLECGEADSILLSGMSIEEVEGISLVFV